MTDYSYSYYLVPSIWNYKNGDRIYGATIMRNEYNQNLKNNRRSSIIKFHGKKSYFVHNNINRHNTWQNKNILHRNLWLGYKNYELKDVDENIVKKKKIYCILKLNSVPELICNNRHENTVNPCSQSSDQIAPKPIFKSDFVNNVISDYSNIERSFHCSYPFPRACCWKVYRCQFNIQEESCCCSCNSDAMFEVMKSLYDCYKKKNCDNCNCILCGHLPREERRLGKLKKSAKLRASVSPEEQVWVPPEKLSKSEAAGLLTSLKDKSLHQKEKLLRGFDMQGISLPEAKTASGKKRIDKVRADVVLPPESKTPYAKEKYNRAMAAGLITPIEGKTTTRKEDILRGQAKMALTEPEGRTPSEKALIAKFKATAPPVAEIRVPLEKLRKGKAAGLLTPLKGKSLDQKEKILRGLAMQGIPLPEAKTASEKKLIDKVRADVGLPLEPKTPSGKEKYYRAMAAGLITPLEGKSAARKEDILRRQAKMGLSLPEGRTNSEKALIAKVGATAPSEVGVRVPSEKLRKAKAAGLLTPLEDKKPAQKEKILRDLVMQGIPLPEAKTASEKKLIDKVRADVGLPPEPKTSSVKEKYKRALAAGLITPLEGKSSARKEDILRGQAKMGLPLPEGRNLSEKALIAKIRATAPSTTEIRVPSEKLRKAKAAGFLTPLKGKSLDQKEKILRGLAMQGVPLPEAQTASEKKLIDKVRADVGLPPEPKMSSVKEKYNRALAAGLITPLEGKSAARKEDILRGQAKMGLPLPKGRTPSEKALIAKVKATSFLEPKFLPTEKPVGTGRPALAPEKLRKLDIKTGKIIKEIKGPSDECICDLLTPETEREIVGISVSKPPLKTVILTNKISSGKLRKAKAEGLLTPLEGRKPEEKERILKELALKGIPLPEAKSASEKKIIDKVRTEVGLPPVPKEPAAKKKFDKALVDGIITPLEGKSTARKKEILLSQAKRGLILPKGRTPSEKAIIAKVKATVSPEKEIISKTDYGQPIKDKTSSKKLVPEGRTLSEKDLIDKFRTTSPLEAEVRVPLEKLRKANAAGLLTPLKGKRPEHKEKIVRGLAMQGIPLPEAKTASEKKLFDKVRADFGLPPEPKSPSLKEKYNRALAAGLITPLEGKSVERKEDILRDQAKMGLPLPEGRTPSEKALIAKVTASAPPEADIRVPLENLRKAKAAELLMPLKGKSSDQKEKILRDLAMQGIPLPEAKTASEKKLIDKVRANVGLPLEPKTLSAKEKYKRAMAAGLITPLEGKSAARKEDILRRQAKMGLPLPEGRTNSEKALIAKVRATSPLGVGVRVPSEKLRKAKAAGLLTPLEDKKPEHKEKILRGLAMQGIPLPDAKTASEKKLIDKVRADVGLPPEPKTSSVKAKYNRALAAGLISPLEGKSSARKEDILRGQAKIGLPLPEGRNPSEKALIAKIRATAPSTTEIRVPSEKLRKAKAAGFLTPLKGKSLDQKEKILRGLAMQGVPLPEAQTASEKKLIDKVRADVGLPPEPKMSSVKEKYKRALAAGLITPLEGKSSARKEDILRGQAKMGLPLPEGRNPSEKALIAKIRATAPLTAEIRVPSEKSRKAEAAGFLTPLKGKSLDQKEKILRGLAMQGIRLPEAKNASEKKLIDKVRADVGLPPEPKTSIVKEKYNRALAAGLITPLEGKSAARKEDILRGQAKMGLPLPEGRTPSEKALIAKVKATGTLEPTFLPTAKPVVTRRPALAPEKLRKLDKRTAKFIKEIKGPSDECICDLLTPETEREIVGISVSKPPLKTVILTNKISSGKLRKAKAEGLLTPLEGKKPEEKERILKELALKGIPLPEAKSASEKKIIDKVRTEVGLPPVPKEPAAKKKFNKALADGIITPLEGKSTARKKEILRNQAKRGLTLPQGRTPSEKAIIAKVKATVTPEKEMSLIADYGLPIKASTFSEKELVKSAKAKGLLTPLKGKTSMQKEKILKGLADAGLPLPEGSTPSEKALVEKVRTIAGLPLEPTPSEKKKRIKKTTKKVGIDSTRKSAKGVGVAKSKGGIIEEFQDIIKTTTCDRGCGCDKKKIRFKHSYVKIRVTSPDISSLCPCPEECLPGVKGEVFTDNDGIKVTIGRITDIPLFTPRKLRKLLRNIEIYGNFSDPYCTVSSINFLNDDMDYYSPSYINSSDIISKTDNFSLNSLQLNTYANDLANSTLSNDIIFIKSFGDHYENSRTSSSVSRKFYSSDTSITSNLESVELLETDSSISLITSSSNSIISFSLAKTLPYSEDAQGILCPKEYYKMKEQNSCSSYFNPKVLVFGICNYNSTTHCKSFEILKSSKEKYDRDFIVLQNGASDVYKFQFLQTPTRYWPGMVLKNCSNAENFETVYRLLQKSILKDSSSLVVMMPTSSEECDKRNSLESLNSYGDFQVTENHSNRIHKLTGLHNSYQNNKGFTLNTKGKHLGKDLTLVEVFNRGKNENGNYTKQEKCSKYCQIRQNLNKYQIISTDTTQDRPCCCRGKENDTKYKRVENYISETVTPMILTEAVPQGQSRETYMNLNENKSLSRMTSNQLHLCNQTPIRLCKAPPCSRHTGHRQPLSSPKDSSIKDVNLMKPCACSINRRHFVERIATEMRSIGCGKSEEDLRGKLAKPLRTAVKVPCEPVNYAKRSCIICVPPQDDKTFSSICKGKERKMKGNKICPCEQDKKKSQTDEIKLLGSVKFEPFSSVGCQCKHRGNEKKKNVKCECPEQLRPQFVFDIRDWIDEPQVRKMKSDLTQTVSGFKLNIPRKTPKSENSFEEILKHFAENTEQINLSEYDSEACSYIEKSQSKQYVSVECECPYEDPRLDKESLPPEETFQGIKLHIGGKGSDSKGLTGILCFELLHGLLLSDSNATP